MAKAKRKAPFNPASIGKERATVESAAKAMGVRVGASGVQEVVRDPLDYYRDHGDLDKADVERNRILWQAGDKYRTIHMEAGLTAGRAVNYGEASFGGGGDPAYGMPQSEFVVRRREEYRAARAAVFDRLGRVYGGVLDAVVIDLDRIEDVAPVPHADVRTRRAFGLEFLRVGLDALARHWGMIGKGGVDARAR